MTDCGACDMGHHFVTLVCGIISVSTCAKQCLCRFPPSRNEVRSMAENTEALQSERPTSSFWSHGDYTEWDDFFRNETFPLANYPDVDVVGSLVRTGLGVLEAHFLIVVSISRSTADQLEKETKKAVRIYVHLDGDFDLGNPSFDITLRTHPVLD